jgi:hypothetical protein
MEKMSSAMIKKVQTRVSKRFRLEFQKGSGTGVPKRFRLASSKKVQTGVPKRFILEFQKVTDWN